MDSEEHNIAIDNQIEPIIQINMTVDEIEAKLDAEISEYNKYTKDNPMLGINWDNKRHKWRLQYENIDTNSKDLKKLCLKMQEKITPKNQNLILKNRVKNFLYYKNEYFILYNSFDKPLFDIRHILQVLNLTDINKKYNQYKDKIVGYSIFKNQHNGFNIRELISEETMYNIVLSSNGTFSKSFKGDISTLLVNLRQNNQLIIEKDKLQIKEDKYKNEDNKINKLLNNTENTDYTDQNLLNYARQLIKDGMKIPLIKYKDKHVLYAFITTLQDQKLKLNFKNRILIKYGYSENILDRIPKLHYEYKCHLYLVGLKTIAGKNYERDGWKITLFTSPDNFLSFFKE